MSLLSVLIPSNEALKAARRFTPARTVMRLSDSKTERRRILQSIKKSRHRARGRERVNPKQLERLREWVSKNPEAARLAQKRWAKENREKINEASRAYRERKKS